jgi:hypothetical protein
MSSRSGYTSRLLGHAAVGGVRLPPLDRPGHRDVVGRDLHELLRVRRARQDRRRVTHTPVRVRPTLDPQPRAIGLGLDADETAAGQRTRVVRQKTRAPVGRSDIVGSPARAGT